MQRYLLALILSVVPLIASGSSIYKWVDEEGTTHYGERPVPGGNAITLYSEHVSSNIGREKTSTIANKLRLQADEMKLSRLERERILEEKKQALIKKMEATRNMTLLQQFGDALTPGVNLDQQCVKKYNMSCDDLANWKTNRIEKCIKERGDRQDCKKSVSRFKPLTIQEQRHIAIQARAARKRRK